MEVPRSPERIPEVLKAIEAVWTAYPDFRLSQLIMCALSLAGVNDGAHWHAEEDKLLFGLEKLRNEV